MAEQDYRTVELHNMTERERGIHERGFSAGMDYVEASLAVVTSYEDLQKLEGAGEEGSIQAHVLKGSLEIQADIFEGARGKMRKVEEKDCGGHFVNPIVVDARVALVDFQKLYDTLRTKFGARALRD